MGYESDRLTDDVLGITHCESDKRIRVPEKKSESAEGLNWRIG